MKVIFFGTPEFAVPSLEILLKNPDFEVIAVVTQPDKKRGRGNQLSPSPVKKVALEHNLQVWQPKNVKKNRKILDLLAQSKADVFAVVAYGQIFSPEMLTMPKLGCVNVHGSILPKYRGAAPIQWSIYHGEAVTGITTMLMDEGMDTGAMLLQVDTPIGLLDNAWQLGDKLATQGADLLVETLLKLEKDEIKPIPQDHNQATYASLIQKSDYEIDWSRSALEIHNQIRAFYPHCVTTFREQSLKVMATIPLGEAYWSQLPEDCQNLAQRWTDLANLSGEVGAIVALVKKWGAVIQTGDGLLLLREVQLAGKRPQMGWDFVNGMRLSLGEKLGSTVIKN